MTKLTSLMVILIFLTCQVLAEKRRRLREGDFCKLANRQKGTCRKFDVCQSAIKRQHENNEWPLICVRAPDIPIVCCDESNGTTTTTPKTIAEQKCQGYSKWLISPASIGPRVLRMQGKCGVNVAPFIIGGVKAGKLEFPHMTHLGFGEDEDDLTWVCGGSLISEAFVLTAAHCTRNRHGFNVTHVRMGHGDPGSVRIIKIKKIHPHPNYKSPKAYNDIALLELEKNVRFSDYRRPACLQIKRNLTVKNGTASGWGITENGRSSKRLLKVDLPFMEHSKCTEIYSESSRVMDRGIDDDTMICAGGLNLRKDTCQGDSGGPLQIVLKDPTCMYSIVGITSIGFICGTAPGVYTRVSAYVPWIESIVWPKKS